jgi:DNA-directed RNA polymerase subunit H (RpoH/RPB5)
MHTLQPKQKKLKSSEVEKLLGEYNIVLAQLPKMSANDPALTEECKTGDVVKIEREEEVYYRVII